MCPSAQTRMYKLTWTFIVHMSEVAICHFRLMMVILKFYLFLLSAALAYRIRFNPCPAEPGYALTVKTV